MRTQNSLFPIVYKIAEMMTLQLLSNTNYLTDGDKTLDLMFLRLLPHKSNKYFILSTPSGRQARGFLDDQLFPVLIHL